MKRHFPIVRPFLVLLLAILLVACHEAADSARLEALVQERLTLAFGPDTLTLASLRRQGSGPLDADAQGRERRIVYYNARLALQRDLDFSSWSNLNVAAFANLLGAKEQGVQGIRQGGNQAGDQVLVHGSFSFVRDGDVWTPVDAVHPQVGTPSAYGPGTGAESKRIIERIRELVERESPNPKLQREIITEELDHAYQAITLRLDRLNRAFLIAGGPPGGEYQAVARLLGQTLVAEGRATSVLETQGSAENIALLRNGQADLALVQNNLADEAQLGTGAFAKDAPFYRLRALASLFPEPIHILLPPDSSIRDLKDLAGKRVAIGAPGSGSRLNALVLLQSAGLELKDLSEVREDGLTSGLDAMAAGQLDAVIATISAPAKSIQDAAARGQLRLLSLAPEFQREVAAHGRGLLALDLPVATYPGQREPIRTLAVTALLVAPETLPAADVDQVLDALFDRIDFVRAGVAAGSQIERASANQGITVPLHPAALGHLEQVELRAP